MSKKSRWWGRRSTDDVDPDAHQEERIASANEETQDATESAPDDEHEAMSEAEEPPEVVAAAPEPSVEEDDPDMTDEERSSRQLAREAESEAETARLARVRALEEITRLRQAERDAVDRAMHEEVEADRAAQERIAAERSAAELAETEAASTERAAEERAAAEAAARRRIEAERLVKQHSEAEQQALATAAEEAANAEEAASKRLEAENRATETGQREREISERASQLRAQAEEAIDRRRASEKAVEELLAKERAARARLAAERAAAARAAAERSLAAQRALEKAQAELAAAEREAAERAQAAKSIAERLARAQAQAERAQSALGNAEHTLAELEDDLDEPDGSAPPEPAEASAHPPEDDEPEPPPEDDPPRKTRSSRDADSGGEAEAVSAPATESAPAASHARRASDPKPKRPRPPSRGVAALRRGAQPLAVLTLLIGASTLAFRHQQPEARVEDSVAAASRAVSSQDLASPLTPVAHQGATLALSNLPAPPLSPQPLSTRQDTQQRDPSAQPAWLRNAVSVGPIDGHPMIAIVIDDMGVDSELSGQAIDMPAPLTLAFLPYAEQVDAQAQRAKAAGHELLIHVPMEPNSRFEDPGPNSLSVELSGSEIQRRLEWAFERVHGVVGINNHMGSRFTRDPGSMQLVIQQLVERRLMFLDSMTSPKSIAWRLAAEASVPYTARDVFLDHREDRGHIRGQLAQLEAQARREGAAVGIGHPRPNTLEALHDWLPAAAERGIRFVPITRIVRHQRGI